MGVKLKGSNIFIADSISAEPIQLNNKIETVSINPNDVVHEINTYEPSMTVTGSIDLNREGLEKLINPVMNSTIDKLKFISMVNTPYPKRTNKRKRITKKWLKKYGYKQVSKEVEIQDIKFDTTEKDGIYTVNASINYINQDDVMNKLFNACKVPSDLFKED